MISFCKDIDIENGTVRAQEIMEDVEQLQKEGKEVVSTPLDFPLGVKPDF